MPDRERDEGFAGARSLASKLAPIADRIRQTVAVGLGVRPYRVFLVWTKWTGGERGEGRERVVERVELTPRPRVEMVTNFQNTPFSGGTLERGILKVDRVSERFSEDDLSGQRRLSDGTVGIGRDESFFWELVEDGRDLERRGGDVRRRMRFIGAHRRAGSAEWVVYVERMDEDRDRDGGLGSLADAESP